jgi:hypothetical protein
MRTEIKALFTGVLALTAVALAGCPGKLRDPERFTDGGVSDGGDTCPDVPTEIFAMKCAGSVCHSGNTPAQNLDLVSPGVASRVVGKPAGECKGSLADPMDPEASLLYIKIAGTMCGSRMPSGGTLTDSEIACVKDWIAEQTPVATTSTTSSTSTGSGAGGAGGAGGGTSTSSTGP